MKIELGNGLLLERADDRNWHLTKLKTKTKGDRAGETYEEHVGWYGSLAVAARGALDQMVGDSDAKNVLELVEEVQQAEARITRACWTIYEAVSQKGA